MLFYAMLGMWGVAAEVAVTFSVCSGFYSVRSRIYSVSVSGGNV